MATFENLPNEIQDLDVEWNGHSGLEVEHFICNLIKELHGNDIVSADYIGQELILHTAGEETNPDKLPIRVNVTTADPNYNAIIKIKEIKVNNNSFTNGININYNDGLVFQAGILLYNYYEILGTYYNLSNPLQITFSLGSNVLIFDNVKPNIATFEDGQLIEKTDNYQYFDVTPLLKDRITGGELKVSVKTDRNEAIGKYSNITIHKIDLSTNQNIVTAGENLQFDIKGLSDTSNMKLQYHLYKLTDAITSKAPSEISSFNSTNHVYLPINDPGMYQIMARITNNDNTFYSNWIQCNIIVKSDSYTLPMAIISNIPNSISNCDNATLYKMTVIPNLGGNVEIISYLSDTAATFENPNINWEDFIFNKTTLSLTSKDDTIDKEYKTYIELPAVGSQQKAVAFKLRIGSTEYPIRSLRINANGDLRASNYFIIGINENPYNINNAFNFTSDCLEDYSQITGQSTTLFTNINSTIESSDGWTTDEDLIAYKISGQDKDLFDSPKNLTSLVNSSQGFTIEVMLKNYNINGDDPVMSIGNLLFGPGYARVNSTDKSEEGIYVNSRADYEKEVITHLMFVYDPAYKPNTYSNIYDLIFTEGNNVYSRLNVTYPILKIYVNGCINREIQITRNELLSNNNFNLQIHPISSDLNLYIFRTYSRALGYAEIQKNFISSRSASQEKKLIYDNNDILDSNGRISFYKCLQKHNVIVFAFPDYEKPLFYGNRKTNGDGKDSLNTENKAKISILVHYKDEKNASGNGLIVADKYKAQGSSAKKYMFHNTQVSKIKFFTEEEVDRLKAGEEIGGSSKYIVPTDPEGIGAKKLVGKVNYASSMQSHKEGSVKLYDRAYKEIFTDGLYNGGKKACLEEPFMYFYYNVSDPNVLKTLKISDLYTVNDVNGELIVNDSDVKFFGFLTWGSGKADDPTYGYDDNLTPEYVLFEGADNASPGANFKQPWAAFQTWENPQIGKNDPSQRRVQQVKSVTESDHTTGLLIEGETIKFENDTDPLDVDYGVTELNENNDTWKFTDAVKNNSLPYFVKFYNNCYKYDFSNLKAFSDNVFDLKNSYGSTAFRFYMTQTTELRKDGSKAGNANTLDVFRWDGISKEWVPAGLHYDNTSWEVFNLKTEYDSLRTNELYIKHRDSLIEAYFGENFMPSRSAVEEHVIPAFKEMFKATCLEYTDVDDIAYHQAFIRLVSGTDNRAKNTYFQIIGKIYQEVSDEVFEPTDEGDYKVRLMQDDLDTIFATDNNGQQVKPYYLLEPPFNLDTESMWGDEHSSFFYPFDICFANEISVKLKKLIEHLIGNSTDIKSVDNNLYKYFFSVLKEFPEIAFNHHAEIYYEVPQLLFSSGNFVQINGSAPYPLTLSGFTNNNVLNPLSLSHGRCLESEYQFMKDRLVLLGTSVLSGQGLYLEPNVSLSTVATGGSSNELNFQADAQFTDYFYPLKYVKTSNNSEDFINVVKINDRNETSINYDPVFGMLYSITNTPNIITTLATPDKQFEINASINTTMGAYLSTANKYKTLHVKRGLDYSHDLLRLPNAKELIINGIETNYSITTSNIVVNQYLPIIETLVLNNVAFTESILDFRNCNRLHTLDLTGCTGIIDIIFPENNRLQSVKLPIGLTKLTIGNNPNLSEFVFAEGTKLTNLSLDCRDFNSNFDYIDLLTSKIDYNRLEQFIIKNTPESGLIITEEIALNLANIVNRGINNLISGKYIIRKRTTNIDENQNITYSWGDKVNIGYNTKKLLVNAFGNIDSGTNLVSFDYERTTLLRSSYKLPQVLSVDVPSGGVTNIKPFDGLYFSEGNNIGITSEGRLNITYSISGLPQGASFNTKTGELSIANNTDLYYGYSIVVTLSNGQSLDAITGRIYLGYIEPSVGDFAYSDGTFSSIYNSDKHLIGLVFQKQVINSGTKWNLKILSAESINDYAGADYYNLGTNNDVNLDLFHINSFMTNDVGLGINMSSTPTASDYTGIIYDDLTDNTEFNNTTITYNTEIPNTLVKSGQEMTNLLANAGKSRLKTMIKKSSQNNLKIKLVNEGLLSTQGEFTDSLTNKNFNKLTSYFNTYVKEDLHFNSVPDYSKVLNPLAFKASIYVPDNLSGKGLEYYCKGNWYIPSMEELNLLITYRIKSTSTSTNTSPSKWNSSEYSMGNSIFSDKSTYFNSFLQSTMLSSDVSILNKNVVYGQSSYYSGSSLNTRYGWFGNYTPDGDYWSGTSLSDCRRDQQYTIAPCCTITVTKE